MSAAKESRKESRKASLRKHAAEETIPGVEEARAAFAPALSAHLARPRAVLSALSAEPPQLLHLEGGEMAERMALALWWAALFNCDSDGEQPCLACPSCLRIGAGIHPDVILLDGRKESIKIADVRALRPVLGEKPRLGRRRVIVLAEAQSLGTEAANSLLKVLEDPCPDTGFIFTAPQRERLLPTLVSRGWVVTLPWPAADRALPAELLPWEEALAGFAREGRGWFDRTAERSAVDTPLARQIALLVEKAVAARLAGRKGGALSGVLRSLSDAELLALDETAAGSQDALQAQVNPLLVLDTLAVRLYSMLHPGQ